MMYNSHKVVVCGYILLEKNTNKKKARVENAYRRAAAVIEAGNLFVVMHACLHARALPPSSSSFSSPPTLPFLVNETDPYPCVHATAHPFYAEMLESDQVFHHLHDFADQVSFPVGAEVAGCVCLCAEPVSGGDDCPARSLLCFIKTPCAA